MPPKSHALAPSVLGVLFILATGGAWAWFNISPKQFPVSYHFNPRPDIPGWTFSPDPISEQARDILSTTNLFNGFYTNASGARITAFMGTWDANNPKQMGVVGHTPDVCWVGAGWEPVSGGHPDKINVRFGTNSIPFEARTFLTPDKRSRELTSWCTLVSGQVFAEEGRFELSDDAKAKVGAARRASGSRHSLRSKLTKSILERIPGTGAKQFVRFSTSSGGDPEASFALLQDFGAKWLELQVSHPGN